MREPAESKAAFFSLKHIKSALFPFKTSFSLKKVFLPRAKSTSHLVSMSPDDQPPHPASSSLPSTVRPSVVLSRRRQSVERTVFVRASLSRRRRTPSGRPSGRPSPTEDKKDVSPEPGRSGKKKSRKEPKSRKRNYGQDGREARTAMRPERRRPGTECVGRRAASPGLPNRPSRAL